MLFRLLCLQVLELKAVPFGLSQGRVAFGLAEPRFGANSIAFLLLGKSMMSGSTSGALPTQVLPRQPTINHMSHGHTPCIKPGSP